MIFVCSKDQPDDRKFDVYVQILCRQPKLKSEFITKAEAFTSKHNLGTSYFDISHEHCSD